MLSPQMTMREFYDSALMTLVHADASPRTIAEYTSTLHVWEKNTTDPPLAEICTIQLAKFRNTIKTEDREAATVNKHLRHINHILAKAGPPGPRNRDALGLITTTPWVRELRTYKKLPKSVPDDAIDLMYEHAGDYFRGFIVAAYNLGSRFTALINLREPDVDLVMRRVHFKPEFDKQHIERIKPLNDVTAYHLAKLKGKGMLRWTASLQTWRRKWNLIVSRAGLDPADRFTPHDLKRTCGTRLRQAGADPWQRRYMLDHAQTDVTGEHYINPLDDLEGVVERMPQPPSFRKEPLRARPQATSTTQAT